MLKNTSPQIKVFKLSTGEEIIVRIKEITAHSNHYVVEKALQIAQVGNGISLVPYFFLIDQDSSWTLNRDLIIGEGEPGPKLRAEYESQITGVALPEQRKIITG